jgi:hypothetical protein
MKKEREERKKGERERASEREREREREEKREREREREMRRAGPKILQAQSVSELDCIISLFLNGFVLWEDLSPSAEVCHSCEEK